MADTKTLILPYITETEQIKFGGEIINSVFSTKDVIASFLPELNPEVSYTLREMKEAFAILDKLEVEATSIELTIPQVQLLDKMSKLMGFKVMSKNLIALSETFENFLTENK